MEDILTSNVFGLFRYLSPSAGVLPFLACAETSEGGRPLAALAQASAVEYEFWRTYHEGDCIPCEPDVVTRITEPSGVRHIVLIEAKFRSGKSSEEDESHEVPCDQLAREWDNLACFAEKEKASPWLVYLTADYGYPFDEVDASRRAFEQKRPRKSLDHPFTCLWLSWRHLTKAVAGGHLIPQQDLMSVVERLSLKFFSGVTPMTSIADATWALENPAVHFEWSHPRADGITWRFAK